MLILVYCWISFPLIQESVRAAAWLHIKSWKCWITSNNQVTIDVNNIRIYCQQTRDCMKMYLKAYRMASFFWIRI